METKYEKKYLKYKTKYLDLQKQIAGGGTPLSKICLLSNLQELTNQETLPINQSDRLYHGSGKKFVFPYFPDRLDNRFTHNRNMGLLYAKKHLDKDPGYLYTYAPKPDTTHIPKMIINCEKIVDITEFTNNANLIVKNNPPTENLRALNPYEVRRNTTCNSEIPENIEKICKHSKSGVYFHPNYEKQLALCQNIASQYFDLVSITEITKNRKDQTYTEKVIFPT